MSKVSVIVPVYNVEQYIKRCLKSILDQSWQDFEILCVDDCGQDQSISIIEQMQKEYPQKIKILYGEQNMGLGAARDRGIKAASGKYIAFIDSDDYIQPNTLETIANVINNYSPDLIIFDYIKQWEDKGILDKILEGNSRLITNKEYLLANPAAWNKIIKTTILKENKIQTYAAHLKGKNWYHEEDYTEGTAFFIGNEGNGLSDELSDSADCLIKIPMEGKVESLNAAMAAGILMYETARQRRTGR